MLTLLFLTLLPSDAAAHDYGPALRQVTTATLKQTGLETDLIKAKGVTKTAVVKWVERTGLELPFTVLTLVVPIVHKKQIRVRTKGLQLLINNNEASMSWRFSF